MKVKKRYVVLAGVIFLFVVGFAALNIFFPTPDIVIYMYHSVREDPVNPDYSDLSVRPSEMEKQLKFFSGTRKRTIFANEIKDIEQKGGRGIVLTFDDGYEDNYTELFPLLKKYGCKATIFVITSKIDTEGYLTSQQIREMSDSGLVSIQSHTVSHEPLALGDKTYEDVVYEFEESKRILEEITGVAVDTVSMPNGSFDEAVTSIAEKYYDVIFTGTNYRAFEPVDIKNVQRVGIYRYHSINDIRRMTDFRGLQVLFQGMRKLLSMLH